MREPRLSLLGRIVAAFRGPDARTPRRAARMYASARSSRISGGLGGGGDTSADAELSMSLQRLRSGSRQMVRDSAYAKRARTIVVNNVVGPGVGMQAQVGTNRAGQNKALNDAIEAAWASWACAESCHTGGAMHFSDLERAAMAQVFDAGEVFIRKHLAPFGDSEVPLALELVEAERVPLDVASPMVSGVSPDFRMGIERDRFGRATFYWIRTNHPGDLRRNGFGLDNYERVPADEVIHLRIIDRWPQTRGEPWLHTSARKLNDMDQYSGSEVAAARASARVFGTIETPDGDTSPLTTDEEDDGTQVFDIEDGTIQQLNPGEKLEWHAPNRPNTALDPFMRAMLREIAAGVGVSYESLSRDYSQSNYSSSRLSLLDDRDLWKTLQQWWIRAFRAPLHKVWMRQAVLARAVPVAVEQYALNPAKFEAVVWKPRGWSWVDPTKEVKAYKEAIRAGLTSATDVIAATADGRDIEDVVAALQRERDLFKDAGITVDTDVAAEQAAAQPKAPPEPDEDDDEGAAAQPARRGPPPPRPVPAKGLMQ
jgi:lambda family phage portal protein